MMSGRFYIDGKDAFTEYGIYVQEGGYNELVAYPPLKAVTSNDWQEVMKQAMNTPAIIKVVPCLNFTVQIKYGSNLP